MTDTLPTPFTVFMGWDSRESDAFDVARYSMIRRSSIPLKIVPLKLSELRSRGLYWRPPDPLASTEFTYSRFLTPFLMDYQGWALYCDCDFLWLDDLAQLLALREESRAVQCVQHDYRPRETVKMDGRTQSLYPRKNWSSLMLFNCAHPSLRQLAPRLVNTATGAYLHRMEWVADDAIGPLPHEWNWLEGWDRKPVSGTPSAVHFTRGGPWFGQWQTVEYADLWLDEKARSLGAL